tara:strand:- start:14216 stop:14989 length:774 start_codon:yes stop_codon:yes gene_type:complete
MVELVGYFLFVFAGLFFGLFGSGGSIIIIPILIYIFNFSIYEATSYSLVLVFLISLFGTVKHIKQKNFQIQNIFFFVLPTLFFTAVSRIFIFPSIPEYINILDISKESLLLIFFSVIIFLSGLSLFKRPTLDMGYNVNVLLFMIGIFIGLLTGLLGIGGGFIIVPALILFAKMNMKQAASSALFIIMLNTFLAIILEIAILEFPFEWDFIVFLLLSSLLGVIIGMNLLNKINMNVIKKLFSISLLLLSLVIFFIELL